VKFLALSIFLIVIISGSVRAQKQLVLIKNEKVLLRLYPGNEFVFRLKGSRQIKTSYVNNISDTAVVAYRDTIPFHKIDRIYFPQTKLYNLIGGAMVVGGGAFFLIDQFNHVVVQGNEPSLDKGVSTACISAVAIGLPLMLIKKKSQKLTYRCRLIMAREGSAFYKPDPHGYESPYLDH